MSPTNGSGAGAIAPAGSLGRKNSGSGDNLFVGRNHPPAESLHHRRGRHHHHRGGHHHRRQQQPKYDTVGQHEEGEEEVEEEEHHLDDGGGGGGGDISNEKLPMATALPPLPPPPPITRETLLYTFCAALNSCNLGYDIGVSTNVGPKIQHHFDLTDAQLEMFLGSVNFFSIFGAVLGPAVSDRCGRRCTFAVAAVGFVAGIAVMATSRNFASLLAGRTIVGLGVGAGEAVDPMYISEIAPPQHRGYLVSWAEAGVAVGVVLGFASSLLMMAIGSYDTDDAWRYMLGLGAVMPAIVLGFVAFGVMPESPRWLITRGREDEARIVLEKTHHPPPPAQPPAAPETDPSSPDGAAEGGRCCTAAVDDVVRDIQRSLEVERAASKSVGWSAVLVNPSAAVRRMLLVGIGMAVIQQAVGIDAIMFYLLFVGKGIGVTSEVGQTWALILLGSIKLGFVFVGARLIDTVGRRPLLFASLIGCAISLVVVSITFVISDEGDDSQWDKVVTVVALGFYLAFFSSGLGPGNWVVVSEVFATSIRAKAMCLAVLPNRITATIMASSFLTLASALTWPGFFLALAAVCLLSCWFLYVYLPETKGKSLEEMSHYFAEVTGDRSILDAEERLMRLYHDDVATMGSGVELTTRTTVRTDRDCDRIDIDQASMEGAEPFVQEGTMA